MFALQCGKQSKSERFRPIVFEKIINKRRNPLFIAMMAKKRPRKEIGRNCLLICVAKTNLNCLKPKTRLLLMYATCQIYVSDMLQIACLEMYIFESFLLKTSLLFFFPFILRQIFKKIHYTTSASKSKKRSRLVFLSVGFKLSAVSNVTSFVEFRRNANEHI